MRRIVFTRPDGGLSIVTPAEGARLAHGITLADGTELRAPGEDPVTADSFLRTWPVAGATVDWAETEDEWIARIRDKRVPPDALRVQVMDEAQIPADRKYREAWRLDAGGAIVIDPARARAIDNAEIRAQLDALDASSKSTRGARELALSFNALIEHLRTKGYPELPATADNAGMLKARAIEDQAAALRARLVPE